MSAINDNNKEDVVEPESHGSHLGTRRGDPGPIHDPVNLMAQIFEDVSDFIGPAPDVLLSWLLRLPTDITPADAAQTILSTTVASYKGDISDEGKRLIELLKEVTNKEVDPASIRKRRGGRAGRAPDT